MSVASKTAFASLTVDSGEDTEDEEVLELAPSVPQSVESDPQPERRPSKTALKKAARLVKKQKEAELAAQTSVVTASAPTPSSLSNSVVESVPTPAEPVESVDTAPATESLTNGHVAPSTPSAAMPESVAAPAVPPTAPPALTNPEPVVPAMKTTPAPAPAPAQPAATPEAAEATKKRQNMFTRTLWTFIMIGTFIVLLLLGHAYMILLVMLCQTLVYREVTALFSLTSSEEEMKRTGKDPWSTTLNWYFFVVTNYFLYGESIIYYFKHVVFAEAQWLPFATNHRIISFTLYTIGFVGFVMSLKKGYLKQQFGLFGWVHMSLMIIVVSSHFIVNNILEGLIWFWVPASLVICNDVFAYIWGITLGRTPLIKLSPKKTVEGFVGAFWSTMIFGLLWGTYFARFNYMICPVQDLGVSAWSNVTCKPNLIFVWREWQIWQPVAAFLSTVIGRQVTTIPYTPYMFHLLFMSGFASLVAPFGGFFASGFKRAFNIKDFGHSIPGHGGMTDRMDCQFLMGVFVYVYHSSIIRDHHVTVGSVLQTIVSGLTVEEQLTLLADLQHYLVGQGISVPCATPVS